MSGRSADRCDHAPPHEHHAVTVAEPSGTEKKDDWLKVATLATADWFRDQPAARLPLLIAPLVYGGGLLLHHFDVPAWSVALPTVAAGIGSLAFGVNRTTGWSTIGLTAATLGTGTWLATMGEMGNSYPLTWMWIGAFSLGYGVYRWARHRSGNRSKPETVAPDLERINWDAYLEDWSLSGASVMKAEPHRLGERARINTKGTNKRASSFTGKGLEERIAEDFDLPLSRVSVTTVGLPAGQISISLQLRDPWASAVAHPFFDADTEVPIPATADVTKPLPIGMDPETGEALTTVLWDEDGAKQTLIVAINGGGKSVTLNDILERLTAANNCVVWGINLSKAQEMRRWSRGLDLAACGRDQRKKARKMLDMARRVIDWRGAQERDTSIVIPSARQPLLVIVIDELDAATKTPDGMPDQSIVADLGYIASKGRSEAVVVILAGQRATQSHAGSTDIRTQMTNFIFLKTTNMNEVARAVGDGVEVPDMGAYGGQRAGVAATVLKNEGIARLGRTFALAAGRDYETGLGQIDRVVADRPPNSLEGGVIAHLGETYAALKNGDMPAETAKAAPQAEAEVPDTEDVRPEPLVTSSDERRAEVADIKRGLFLVPNLTPEGIAKLNELRNAQRERVEQQDAAAASPMNPHTRQTLITLLRGRREGLANAEVRETFDISDRTALRYLQQLADEGVAERRGQGPATRWFPVSNEHVA